MNRPSPSRRLVQKFLLLAIGFGFSLWPVAGGTLDALRSTSPSSYVAPLFLLFLGFTLPAWLLVGLVALGLLVPYRLVKLGCTSGAALATAATLALLLVYGGVQGAAAVRLGAFPSSPGIPVLLLLAAWFAWAALLAWLDLRQSRSEG